MGRFIGAYSISSDKGRKIHRRDALEFYNIFEKGLVKTARNLNTGIIIVVTVPDRLPADYSSRKLLCSKILNQVTLRESSVFDDQIEIRIEEFDFSSIGIKSVGGTLTVDRELLDRITSTTNKEVMVLGNQCGGGVVTVLQSREDDSFLKSIFSTLEVSATKQVSKTRPVLFFVSFHDLEDGALREIGDESGDKPTALRIKASEFLNRHDMNHVVGVHFVARGSLEPRVDGKHSHSGTTYSFSKPDSTFWEQEFEELFRENGLRTEL